MVAQENRPRFTIVTLSYNQADFLARAIESVSRQRDVGVEYIVVDPGSTDASREIIAHYRDVIDHVIFTPDDGPADGLQRAFACATGQYYGCINADDALLPGALQRVAAMFDTAPTPDVVLGGGYRVDRSGRPMKLSLPTATSPARLAYGIAEFFQQATFVSAEAFHRVGGYNVHNRVSWDGELMVHLSTRGGASFKRLLEPLAIFTIHEAGITGSGKLLDLYHTENIRLFQIAMGRSPAYWDRRLAHLGRVYKIVTHPVVTGRKLAFYVSPNRKTVPLPLVPGQRSRIATDGG